MKKRLLSILLSVCMVLTLLPTVALATDTTADLGDFSVTYDDAGTAPTYENGVLTFTAAGEYTIGMADENTSNRIVVNAIGEVKLNLNGVVIEAPNGSSAVQDGATALTVTSGSVTLNVIADSSLTGGMGNPSLMEVGKSGAGISGNITVMGTAALTATGGAGASTPGGTGGAGGSGISGNVTVTEAATLTATGGAAGAGYPNGIAGVGIKGNVDVSGTATLTAISGSGLAGIAISDANRYGGGTITVGEGYIVKVGANATAAAGAQPLPHDQLTNLTSQYIIVSPPTPQAKWGVANDGAAPGTWVGSGTLDAAMTYANANSGAYIQLLTSVNITATLEFAANKTTVLDLNGKTINGSSIPTDTDSDRNVLSVNGNLTLCDTSSDNVVEQGKITGGHGAGEGTGGGVYVYTSGTFTMTGGNITGNTAVTGGGVANEGTFTLTEGNISGNVVENGTDMPSMGGGVANLGSFNMTGGSITDNHADAGGSGGGVFTSEGMMLSGSVKISGNTVGEASDNVALMPYSGHASNIYITGELTNSTPIGVSIVEMTEEDDDSFVFTPKAGIFTSGTTVTNSDYISKFVSDNSGFAVIADDSQLKLAAAQVIAKATATNGSFTVKVNGNEAPSAIEGQTVTITPTANANYELDTITVCKTENSDTAVTVTNGSFTMPAYAVTVSVTFKAASASLDLTGVGCDVAAGKLTGTTTNMQYSLDGGSTWQDCAADNTAGLTFAVGTVKVRQKDKTTNERTVITIAAPVDSSTPTLESKTSGSVTLIAMAGYEYSRDGGSTWQDSNSFSGLSSSTAYSFVARVKATAAALPGTVSTALAVTTDSAPSGGATVPDTGAPVIVDGKTQNIGTEKKAGDTTTVTVDQAKLGTNIGGAASGSSVVVPVSENGSATASLVVKNIEDMAAKSMTLTVQTGSVSYNLNTSAIDIAALTAAFLGADMSKVPFDVTITNSAVSVAGETLVLSPVAFTVTATYGGKTVDVDTFSAYIDRVIEVTKEQAAKITTAVVVNVDGSVCHVPTNVIEKDGKYYAIINSRTNSTYALIQNEVTFADATGKWYEAAVNEMGSRKIIAGRSASAFDGDASITRAEFAVILVRALGLPADGISTFSDVPADAWYSGYVATAVKYGLTEGKGDNQFDPKANITRQEAMLMLQRAAALTDFTGASGNLDSFADANSVGSWALGAARWSVGSGLVQGSGGKLNPTANITRAESATVILRLLQKAGLVDVRSKT